MKTSIWKTAFSSGGKITQTQLKNGTKNRSFLSSLNTTGVATLSFALSTAIIYVAANRCRRINAGNHFLYEINDYDNVCLRYRICCDKVKTKIKAVAFEKDLIGTLVPEKNFTPITDSFVHFVVFIPRVFELLADIPSFQEAFDIIKQEIQDKNEIVSDDAVAALFILNDYLYESRQKYEPEEDASLSCDIDTLMTEENQGNTTSTSLDEYLFDDILLRERAILTPDTQIPDGIRRLARIVKGEMGSSNPVNNLLLYGEAGAGKSTAAKIFAHLWGLPYGFTNLSLNTEEGDLIGSYRPDGKGDFEFHLPVFAKMFIQGGVIEMMEINYAKPGVIGVLNSALDHTAQLALGNGEVVSRHKNCIIIVTTNVDYAGCQKMNEAVKDRFHHLVDVKKLPDNILVQVISKQSGNVDTDLIRKMIDAADRIVLKMSEEGITGGVCSTRQLINWARASKYMSALEAAEETILPGVSLDKSVQGEIKDTILVHMFRS